MAGPLRRRYDPYAIVQRLQGRYGGHVSNRLKGVLKYSVLAAVLIVIASVLGVQVTSKARFCVTCHYMRPYYDSWKTSKHKDVECVECHFPPGLESVVRHKFEASVQIVKYVTKQYGTRPWTQIQDASCLRSGCHVRHTLPTKELREGASFAHLTHLTQFRRVTRLRCTSCHSQIVQGSHMAATLSTCFLCHFKNVAKGSKMSRCTGCHKLPIKSKLFDHTMANDLRVSCLNCHGDVIQGEGKVARDRCVSCHSEPDRLKKYGDVAFMHLTHVTNHEVDCLLCHDEIRHSLPRKEPTKALICSACHPNQHAATKQLYAGGAVGASDRQPAPMYEARVACGACHLTHQKLPNGSDVFTAGLAGCANCHGEQFGVRLARDRSQIAGLVEQARPAVTRAQGIIGAISDPVRRAKASALADAADKRVAVVEQGGGIHNPSLARRLLYTAAQEVNRAMVAAGNSYRVNLVAVAKFGGMPDKCMSCHTQGYPAGKKHLYGVDFSHEQHVDKGLVECSACHETSSAGSGVHGKVRIDRNGCRACHERRLRRSPHPGNWRKAHGDQAKVSADNCRVCHDSSRCNACHKLPMPHPQDWRASHPKSGVAKDQRRCAPCHKKDFCATCHRGSVPSTHVPTWRAKHGSASLQRGARCKMCHSNRFCSACHALPMPHPPGWDGKPHGAAAAEKAGACATCHERADCQRCHSKRPPAWHKAPNFDKQHATQGPDGALCDLCHGPKACNSCHQNVPMPHAREFKEGGHGQLALKKPATCASCHKDQKWCLECHRGQLPMDHVEDRFAQGHGDGANPARCAACHGQDACTTCHAKLTESPHSEMFAMEHKEQAAFEKTSKCFVCHKIDYCQMCHPDATLK